MKVKTLLFRFLPSLLLYSCLVNNLKIHGNVETQFLNIEECNKLKSVELHSLGSVGKLIASGQLNLVNDFKTSTGYTFNRTCIYSFELENVKVFDDYLLILKGSNGTFTQEISWETINKMSDESHVITLKFSTYKED